MNYGDLKTHFTEVLNRTDITTALTTKFIDQGLQRLQRVLRIPAMEHQEIYAMSANGTSQVSLPNAFLETIDLYHSEGGVLERIPMAKMIQEVQTVQYANPTFYSREQGKLWIYPYPTSGNLVLNYYGDFEPFVDDTTETTISKIAPDLLIYSALTYAAIYYLDEREVTFEQKYQQLLAEIQEQAYDQELNGGTQVINSAYKYED